MRHALGWWIGLVFLLLAPRARAESLEELVGRADRALQGKTSAAVLRMDVKTQSYARSYRIVLWDDSSGSPDKTLIKILGPTAFRGYATLKVGGLLKIYDPKTDHVQVIGQSMLGDSWMGSHFSNDDLVKETRLARDYTAQRIDAREGPNERGTPGRFERIRLLPKPTAPVVWGRIVYELWAGGDRVLPVRAEYFAKQGDEQAARTLTFAKLRDFDGRLLPSELELRVRDKPGEYTRLTYEKLRFDVAIPASQFTEQALR